MGDWIDIAQITDAIMPNLVSRRVWGEATFIALPLVYPSGSFVTVCLTRTRDGVRVSDSGHAYREADSFGAGRSFGPTAKPFSESVVVGRRSIYLDVRPHEVERAIFDVSSASYSIAERIVERAGADVEVSIIEALHERLERLFPSKVEFDGKIIGASMTEWDVSAVAKIDGHTAVFQAVSHWPVAIYKASTAFRDLSLLENPPTLISVISDKSEMGNGYNILAQAGKVIEIDQQDDVFMRAAA